MGAVEVNGYTIEPGAYLEAADLAGANLDGTNLTYAYADKDSQWPEGFDPLAAGVTFV